MKFFSFKKDLATICIYFVFLCLQKGD